MKDKHLNLIRSLETVWISKPDIILPSDILFLYVTTVPIPRLEVYLLSLGIDIWKCACIHYNIADGQGKYISSVKLIILVLLIVIEEVKLVESK